MKIDTSYNNFARGQIDHDMNGRYDLPVYRSAADLIENFITNFKGNAIYSAGFESMFTFQDCTFIEFKFNKEQEYLCVFYNTKIKFLSYASNGVFGFVQSGGGDLEVTTPYSLAETSDLQFTQDDDVMVITHEGYQPHKLTRVAADDFTFTSFARKNDPFNLTFTGTQVITAITKAANAQITVATHGRVVDEHILIQAVVGMTEINNFTARIVSVVDPNNITVDIDTTDFTTYSSAGTINNVATIDPPASCLFYRGRLYYGATTLKITTLFGSVAGGIDDFTTTPVTAASAFEFTLKDMSNKIEWLFAGNNSLIVGSSDAIIAVNGGGVGIAITAETIDTTLTDAPPCNSSQPLAKDGFIFYHSVDGRIMYYFNYDLLTESFQAQDANFISYDITKGGMTKLRHKRDRNDLIFCTTNSANKDLLSCSFKKAENIIGWHKRTTDATFEDVAVIKDNNGAPQLITLALRNSAYYIEHQGEYVEFSRRVDFFTSKTSEKADDEAYMRKTSEELKSCIYLDNSQTFTNLQVANTITYDSGAGTITAASGVFVSGDVGKHIVYKTTTGYESGRFLITAFTSTTVVTVDVLQTPTSTTHADWYLTFSALSGLTQYNNTTVRIVTDGGFLDDFAVSANAVDLERQVTHAVVGYGYKGIIKSFALGFQVQGVQTQRTRNNIKGFSIRCVDTAGGEVGATLYKTEDIQKQSQDDINYLPPRLVDKTISVHYNDEFKRDKFFFIVQDEPLPMVVTSLAVTTEMPLRTS